MLWQWQPLAEVPQERGENGGEREIMERKQDTWGYRYGLMTRIGGQ